MDITRCYECNSDQPPFYYMAAGYLCEKCGEKYRLGLDPADPNGYAWRIVAKKEDGKSKDGVKTKTEQVGLCR